MPEFWLHDGSAARKATELYYHDGTAVRKVKEAWYHDGTAPRKVFSGVVVAIPGIVLENSIPAVSSASLLMYADGSIAVTGSASAVDSPYWIDPAASGVGAAYWARLTVTSGAAPTSGSGAGAWVNLGATVSWVWTRSPVGSTVAVVTLEIATDSGGAAIVATRTGIPVTATREP